MIITAHYISLHMYQYALLISGIPRTSSPKPPKNSEPAGVNIEAILSKLFIIYDYNRLVFIRTGHLNSRVTPDT